MSGRMLRPEARPLDLGELSLSQLEVLDRVVRSLADAHSQLPSAAPKEGLPELDPQRSSRLFFVSGEPGIGKTTIYTALRKLLPEERGSQEQSGGKEDAFQYDKDQREVLKRRIREGADQLRGGVRWLEPLDLEPLSGSTNFLAAVMVRIERAMETGGALKHRGNRGGLLDQSSDISKTLAKLSRFQNDLAMSWDGNIHARAAHVEPDTYAAEVLRAERARLAVNKSFQEILSKLVPIRDEQQRKPSLFLLVVDDLYLSPSSSIELLRLLRMISSPQLFVLLLGDYDLLDYLYRQQTLGDYIKLTGNSAYTDSGEDFAEELRSRAWALATGSLRKLLPPNQKSDLATLWVKEALGFKALDARETNTGKAKSLEDLLSQLEIRKNQYPITVKELITADWQERTNKEEKERERLAYSGALLLEMPPRHATDLWMTLNELGNKPPITKILGLLGDEFHTTLGEQNRLSGTPATKLEQAVTRGTARTNYEDYTLNTTNLSLDIEKADTEHQDFTPEGHPFLSKLSATIPKHISWHIAIEHKNTRKIKSNLDLPPRLLGWLVTFHDILALGRPENILGGSLVGTCSNCSWVEFQCTIQKTATSSSQTDELVSLTCSWPLPDWTTFLELDLLIWAWNNLSQEDQGQPIHLEARAFRWLDAICVILLQTELKKLVRIPDLSKSPPPPLWQELSNRIGGLISKWDGSTSQTARWATNVGIMVATRMGICESTASIFEQTPSLNNFWKEDEEIKALKREENLNQSRHKDVAKYFPKEWPPPLADQKAHA